MGCKWPTNDGNYKPPLPHRCGNDAVSSRQNNGNYKVKSQKCNIIRSVCDRQNDGKATVLWPFKKISSPLVRSDLQSDRIEPADL